MDKQTLSNYGWIVICVMFLAVMLAFASPFGKFVAGAVQSTTQGLFDVNQNALDAAGIEIMQQEFEEMLNGGGSGENGGAGESATDLINTLVVKANGNGEFYGENGTLVETVTGFTTVPEAYRTIIVKVIIENGITAIGRNAFRGCSALETIEISASVTTIGSDAFYGCSSLTTIEYLGTTSPVGSFPRGINPTIYVPADYEGDHFCRITITRR